MTPGSTRRRALLGVAAVVATLGPALSACTKHEGLILLDLRASGPLGAPTVYIRLSAKGWPTRTVTGSIGPAGFLVGYYGPADGSAVIVTAEALGGESPDGGGNCVVGKGSATVPPLASGGTSDATKLFIRPIANDCTVVDAGTDASTEDAGGEDTGGQDAAEDAGDDATADSGGDATEDAGTDTEVDAGTDAGDDAAPDAGTD